MRALLTALVSCLAITASAQQEATPGTGAVLRALEKVTGQITDLEMRNGDIQTVGRLSIILRTCRYPTSNPSSEAYAFMTIREEGASQHDFEGWMVASSPALNALEHPRYDVWVLRCTTD